MKAYVATTCVLFGLLAVAHVWRVLEEGPQLIRDPFFALITVAVVVLCVWGLRILRVGTRS